MFGSIGPNGRRNSAFALAESDPGRKDMLLDIATEEMSHLEVIGSLVVMLNRGVKGKIAEVYPTKATEIGVTVNSGVVTLSGTVENATQRKSIEDAANSVHGVKSVIDNTTIKP